MTMDCCCNGLCGDWVSTNEFLRSRRSCKDHLRVQCATITNVRNKSDGDASHRTIRNIAQDQLVAIDAGLQGRRENWQNWGRGSEHLIRHLGNADKSCQACHVKPVS